MNVGGLDTRPATYAPGASEAALADALRLSRLARIVEVGGMSLIANLATPDRLVIESSLARAARLLETPRTADQFIDDCPPGVDGKVLLRLLREHSLIVPAEADEVEAYGRLLSASEVTDSDHEVAPGIGGYQSPRPLYADRLDEALPEVELHRLDVLLLGGCVLEFAQDTLRRRGRERGYAVSSRHQWLQTRLPRPLWKGDERPHITVLQPTVQTFLGGVWDDGPLQDAAVRERRAKSLARFYGRLIGEFADRLDGGLGLVHNVAPPAVSPFGRLEFRTPAGARWTAAQLNSAIDAAAARYQNVMVVDEERLALKAGGERLFDDLLFPFGHHGGSVDPAIAEAHQLPALSEALSHEYLALYEVFTGARAVRCIAVDLDGVLWPGVAAEDGMSWLDEDTTTKWIHQGLNQALRILQRRGILLVSLSKGSHEVTMRAWLDGGDSRLLGPDEFVMHSIEWGSKADRIAAIQERLGLRLEDLLLIDDNPVERAEMRARLPGVQVADVEVSALRSFLLTDPRFEPRGSTGEASSRTETTKAMLRRAELEESMSREEFLDSLAVEIEVRPLSGDSERERAQELLARTTQFNTAGAAMTYVEAGRLLSIPGAVVAAAWVRDRFAEYGLCGLVVVVDDRVEAVALSCRVIGLDVAAPILVAGLEVAGCLRPGVIGVMKTERRNAPSHGLFEEAGFIDAGGGRWKIADPGEVARSGAGHHVRVSPEAAAPRPGARPVG